MHKYQPRIHLFRRSATATSAVITATAGDDRSGGEVCSAASVRFQLQNLTPGSYRTFVFPETEFIAVTAYQNQMVRGNRIAAEFDVRT